MFNFISKIGLTSQYALIGTFGLVTGIATYKHVKQRYIRDEIDISLSTFFDVNGKEFSSLLRDTGSIIIGSFPLAYLTQWSFMPNDIDVFIPFNKEDVLIKYLLDNGFSKTDKYDEYYKTLSQISRIIEFTKNNKRIQLIILSDKTYSIKDVINTIDFDICKVGYDGNKIMTSDDILEGIKRCEIKIHKECSEQRKKKYQARGFKFVGELK